MWARFAVVCGAHALVLFTEVGAPAIVLTNRRSNALGLTAKRFSPTAIVTLHSNPGKCSAGLFNGI
jgi:hypothetical protein